MRGNPWILTLIVSLSSCADVPPPMVNVNVNVTTFHRLPMSVAGHTFAVTPTDSQTDSLEYAAYRQQVVDQLYAYGLREVPLKEADFAVAFDYFIDNGQVRTVSIPVWGQTGVSGATTSGTSNVYGNAGTYNQSTTYTATYGVTGFVPQSLTVFTRRLNLIIVDAKQLGAEATKRLYETNAVSVGRSGQLAIVAPKMITAVFTDFPGLNGSSRSVAVPCPECAQ